MERDVMNMGREQAKSRYEALLKAEAENPQDLSVKRELLLLGNGWRMDGDPASIKSYLFHGFEHPEMHDEEDLQRMAREFFDDPRLKRCLQLAGQPSDFIREYLRELSGRYIDMFIWHQKEHVPSLFGFVLPKRLPGYLAVPMGDVIQNIFLCPFLSVEEQQMLAGAFYRACYEFLNGQTAHLDDYLGADIRALIV